MFHFASKGGYYLSAAFIQERPLIEHIRYVQRLVIHCLTTCVAVSGIILRVYRYAELLANNIICKPIA